ncbi:MAG: LytTR family DNA-binding domain-containing protein [Bacteroidales bacterium]|nr:LytTR family DNA-binding domain-containing protein [Bacteroidales bacterium]
MSTKYSIVIVDDEPLARELVKNYLSHRNDINIIAECSNGFECISFLNKHRTDILLLDIQMPKINGFELLEILNERPHVIFSTAYDEYAIKAFEENAIHYLLKPYSKEKLFAAIDRCIEQINLKNTSTFLPDKLNKTYTNNKKIEKIIVRHNSKTQIINIDDIIYFESAENYVKIRTHHATFIQEKTMKYFEENLPEEKFIRLHRSYIVNINYIVSIEAYTKDSYIATLKNNEKIKVSQEGYKKFRNKFK